MANVTTATTAAYVRGKPADSAPPPLLAYGPVAWARANLFPSVGSTLLTLVVLYLLFTEVPPLIRFLIVDAVWTGTDRAACLAKNPGDEIGPCWPFIWARLNYFIYGQYPEELRWRVNLVFILEAVGIVWLLAQRIPMKGLAALFFFVVFPLLAFGLLTGANPFAFHQLLPPWLLGLVLAAVIAVLVVLAFRARPRSPWLPVIGAVAVLTALGLLEMALAPLGVPRPIGGLWGGVAATVLATVGAVMPPSLALFVLAVILAIVLMTTLASERHASLAPLVAVLALIAIVASLETGWSFLAMPKVSTNLWGGVLVTLVISTIGIVVSLPFGTVLALGRRSKMPFVRFACVLFIEIVRGVPLITMLFMANRMLPLFLSQGMQPDALLRVIIGVSLFASAYMAEVVRGGLQSIPKGQYEGAMSLGLGYWTMMILIILPQALKLVIPGIVNSFIALFKDTTLVTVVGIADFLTTVQYSINAPEWSTPGTAFTGYIFAAMFYFVCCYSMARYSLAMERRLAAGQHR